MIEKIKLNKKSLIYLGIVLAIAVLVCVAFIYYSSKPKIKETPAEEKPAERTMKEIIQDLTAPEGAAEPVSEEVMEGITAPKSSKGALSVPDDVLKSLSAPE